MVLRGHPKNSFIISFNTVIIIIDNSGARYHVQVPSPGRGGEPVLVTPSLRLGTRTAESTSSRLAVAKIGCSVYATMCKTQARLEVWAAAAICRRGRRVELETRTRRSAASATTVGHFRATRRPRRATECRPGRGPSPGLGCRAGPRRPEATSELATNE